MNSSVFKIRKCVELAPAHEMRQILDLRKKLHLPCYNLIYGLIGKNDFSKNSQINVSGLNEMSPVPGMLSLREKVASWAKNLYLQEINYQNILITAGANAAFNIAIDCLTEPGDLVGLNKPYFFNHFMALHKKNRLISYNFSSKGINALVVTNPNNPAGTFISAKDLKKLESDCYNKKIPLILDRSYFGYSLNEEVEAKMDIQKTVTLVSFSKILCLPDCRIGGLIGSKDLITNAIPLQDCEYITTSKISQSIVLERLDELEELTRKNKQILKEKNILFRKHLLDMCGLQIISGEAGPFLWLKYSKNIKSVDLCFDLAEKTGILTTPGFAYGQEDYIRIGFGLIGKSDIPKIVNLLKEYF